MKKSDCNEVNELLRPFLQNELPGKTTDMILRHIEHCPDCKDELETYYMLDKCKELLDDNEEDENYNLKESFRLFLTEKRKERKKTILERTILVIVGIAVAIALFFTVKELL